MDHSKLRVVCAVAGLLAVSPTPALRAQGVNPDGHILSTGWLALGPFSTEYAGSFLNNDFLLPFLAPSLIQYQTPEPGEEIDYDPIRVKTTLYRYEGPHGPTGRPLWRTFQNARDSGTLNFLEDSKSYHGPETNGMTYAATYFDFLGDTETTLDLCVGSDDGVQVWLDAELIYNLNTNRDQKSSCQDLVSVKVTPGSHRIVLGVWSHPEEWSGSLGLRQADGTAITDSELSWRFRGTKKPPGFSLPNAGFLRREIRSASNTQTCPAVSGSGPLLVTIRAEQLPDGPKVPILKEIVSGSFGPEKVLLHAGSPVPGEVTARVPGPMRQVGGFDGSYVFTGLPDCPSGNGSASFDDGGTSGDPGDDSYTLTNVGYDLYTAGDGATFAFLRAQGDFEVIARIKNRGWVPGSFWSEIGVTARQDLTTRSRYASVTDYGEDPQYGNDFEGRSTHGGRDGFFLTVLDAYLHHDWLKLKRTGSTFEGFSAPSLPDGSAGAYVKLGDICLAEMPETALVGVFVKSQTLDCSTPASGTFDHFQFSGQRAPPAIGDAVGVEIVWKDIPREALRSGLGYSLLLDPADGLATLDGYAVDDRGAGFPIFGEGEATPLPATKEFGPFADPDFPHAHEIGVYPGLGHAESPTPGKIVISASGRNGRITGWLDWYSGDRLFYAYREVTGDFSARVSLAGREVPPESPLTAFGIMARQDCGLRSRSSFVQDCDEGSQGHSSFNGRKVQDGYVSFNFPEIITKPFPFPGQHANTLRLDRCGNVFKGYVLSEPDPQDPSKGTFGGKPGEWVSLGEEDWSDDAPPSVLVGLAVTSHLDCEVATITFDRWRLYPACGEPPPARFVRGDVDSDGAVDLTDAVRILDHLFLGGPAPECLDAADTDDDAELSLTDPIVVLSWLFLGGPAPEPPSPTAGSYPGGDCGTDPTASDGLDCFRPGEKCR
jgi:hypothetical protein